ARERHRRLGAPRGAHARRPDRVRRAQRDPPARPRPAGRRPLTPVSPRPESARGALQERSPRRLGSRRNERIDPRTSSNLTLILLLCEIGFLLVPPLMNWDKTKRSFVLAVRGLWLHKLRAFLSVLGIIIGTAAVIALMAFGEGSMHDALEDI